MDGKDFTVYADCFGLTRDIYSNAEESMNRPHWGDLKEQPEEESSGDDSDESMEEAASEPSEVSDSPEDAEEDGMPSGMTSLLTDVKLNHGGVDIRKAEREIDRRAEELENKTEERKEVKQLYQVLN